MISMRTSEAARLLGVEHEGVDVLFTGCMTDSRVVARGALFVALRGERFDGHDFIDHALERGAAAVLVDDTRPRAVATLRVADSLAALGRLAGAWRARHAPALVGITGSAGKTTVKEMLASILGVAGPVLATTGNFNNEIGVPLTLVALGQRHRYAVIEMGANHVGEIGRLAAIAAPAVGLITCCGPAHLEGFGSVDTVARAKGELIAALPPDGVAVLNADDARCAQWREMAAGRRVTTFGRGADADVRWAYAADAGTATIATAGVEVSVALSLVGAHNAGNAAAAVAAAQAVGVDDPATWQAGLAAVAPVGGRLQPRSGTGAWRVLDDAYNANPLSLDAALEGLGAAPGPRWLGLGDMADVGDAWFTFHRRAGAISRSSPIVR